MDENVDAWDLWQAVRTQWRAAGFGLIGLDYPAVEWVANKIGIDISADVLSKLQILENCELSRKVKD